LSAWVVVTHPVIAARGLSVGEGRSVDRRPVLVGAVGCTVIGAAWLFALPGVLPWVAASVLGLGLGGGFSLALALLVDYTAPPAASSRLIAMVFLVGCTSAAVAPVGVGALRDRRVHGALRPARRPGPRPARGGHAARPRTPREPALTAPSTSFRLGGPIRTIRTATSR
jgi:hypothetical protein